MAIKGWDESSRKWQRLGKINLGKIIQKNGREMPSSSDQFEISDELRQKLAKIGVEGKITELDIMFPSNSLNKNIPCHLKRYNSKNELVCKGDGETAWVTKDHLDYIFSQNKAEYVKKGPDGQYTYSNGTPVKSEYIGGQECIKIVCKYKKCPFYAGSKKLCREVATINVVLQKLDALGVYSIETSSYNSFQNIKNGINMIKNAVGYVQFIPLKLRIKMEQKGAYKKTFPILYLDLADGTTLEDLINEYKGKAPAADEPQFDPEDDANKPVLLYPPEESSSSQQQKPQTQENPPKNQSQNQSSNQNPNSKPPANAKKSNLGLFEVVNARNGKKNNTPFLQLALKQIGGKEPGQIITAFALNRTDDAKTIIGKQIVPEIEVQKGNNGAQVNMVKNFTVVAS